MPLVIEPLPFSLADVPSGGTVPFRLDGIEYDVAIGDVPFLHAPPPLSDKPYQRATAPYRKDQFDNNQEPGEQSLQGWWVRSQSSFHGGTGLDFEIPYSVYQPRVEIRFADSVGLDVFTAGKVTLLPATALTKSAGGSVLLQGAVDANGADCYLQAEGAVLTKVTEAATQTLTTGGSGTIVALAFDGTHYFAADSTSVWKDTVPAAGAGSGAAAWNTGSANVVLGWVKSRLMAGIDNKIYELVGAGPALPTAAYTHPNSSWRFTAIAEGPSAIYFGGKAGSKSSIMRLALTTAGAVPTLTSAIDTPLPDGEYVTSLLAYLNQFLVVGTNRGVRIALIDPQSGDLQLGPLNVKTSAPVYGLTAYDRFVYAGVTNYIAGNSGLCRLDLATQNSDGFYAYATDLQAHVSGTVNAVCQYGSSGRLVVGVAGHGSYLQKADGTLESTGYLLTERIRFHTLDAKVFKFLDVRTAPINGSISISQVDAAGNATSLVTFSANSLEPQEIGVASNIGPQEFMQFKFTLSPAGNTSPEFHGYQLKALPGAKRQRQMQFTFLCQDSEEDRQGNSSGYDGYGLERLKALESLEEDGDVVLLQDFARDENRLVVIDGVDYFESSTPTKTPSTGGVVVVTLRSVT